MPILIYYDCSPQMNNGLHFCITIDLSYLTFIYPEGTPSNPEVESAPASAG